MKNEKPQIMKCVRNILSDNVNEKIIGRKMEFYGKNLLYYGRIHHILGLKKKREGLKTASGDFGKDKRISESKISEYPVRKILNFFKFHEIRVISKFFKFLKNVTFTFLKQISLKTHTSVEFLKFIILY